MGLDEDFGFGGVDSCCSFNFLFVLGKIFEIVEIGREISIRVRQKDVRKTAKLQQSTNEANEIIA